jgi:SAM-dependent methyltransferase
LLQLESIDYDPFKTVLGNVVSRNSLLRRLFYAMLGLLFLRQWHVRSVLKKMASDSPAMKDIFDAGSGYGQYSYLMAKLFPQAKIFAVDVKQEQIEDCRRFFAARGKTNVQFELGDLTVFERPNSFDLALSVDVMEHILDDVAVYRHVYNSLRPGGMFIINTPRTDKEESHHDIDSPIGEHVREGYTEDEFIAKITGAGFVIDRLRRTHHPLWGRFAWTVLQRIPMWLLARSKAFIVLVVPWIVVFYLPAALCMAIDVMASGEKGWGWLMIARKP